MWDILLDNVMPLTSTNVCKNSLDKLLHAQDVYFKWKADLTGTGD